MAPLIFLHELDPKISSFYTTPALTIHEDQINYNDSRYYQQ